jgi:uncharacterized spore protein YtfJ
MENKAQGFTTSTIHSQEQGMELMNKLASTARPEAVFGQPATYGEHTIITTNEVMSSLAFGFGGGDFGEAKPEGQAANVEKGKEDASPSGTGGGGGGGGVSLGRPVAVIVINPAGVTVQPIFDMTKISIATLTAFASIFSMFGKVRRSRRH